MSCDYIEVAKEQRCISEKENAIQGNLRASNAISFTVYGKPIPKDRPRVVKGHVYTPKETVEQEETIVLVYKSIYHDFKFDQYVPLRVETDFYLEISKTDRQKKKVFEKIKSGKIRPTKAKALDVDNGLKLVLDALNKVAYFDDSQIVETLARKYYSEKPRTEIRIMRVQSDAI